MNKTLFAAVLLAGSSAAFAQSTLTAANFNPQLNDAFQTRNCTSPETVSPGLSGAGITWNFSGLVSLAMETNIGKAVTVASTAATVSPLYYAAVNANSNMAVTASLAGVVSYSNGSTTKLSNTGVYKSATENSYYTDPLDQLQYPVTYNTKFSDTYSGYITYTGTPIHESGIIYDTCDGYGSLILPIATGGTTTYANVLRVHSSQTFADSADLFGTGTPTVNEFQTETYTWYCPGYHSALLTISNAVGLGSAAGFTFSLVNYAERKISDAGVSSIPGIGTSLKLYPNPAKNMLNISFDVTGNENTRVSISDMLGREIAEVANNKMTGAQSISYNTSSITPGIYQVHVQSAAETITKQIQIQ